MIKQLQQVLFYNWYWYTHRKIYNGDIHHIVTYFGDVFVWAVHHIAQNEIHYFIHMMFLNFIMVPWRSEENKSTILKNDREF